MKPAQKTSEELRKSLTPKQIIFCEYYASDREFFGNGVEAYAEAYNINLNEHYGTARANSHRLLTNADILAYIDFLLDEMVINDQHADKQLGFWMTQKASPQAATTAIKEYNQLKGRITKKILVDDTQYRDIRDKVKGFLDDPNTDNVPDDSAGFDTGQVS